MIHLCEQHGGFGKGKCYNGLSDKERSLFPEGVFHICRSVKRRGKECSCVEVEHGEESDDFLFKSSYFVGVDWLVENKLPVYVRPKLDEEEREIDCFGMLYEAMEEPLNFEHLDGLCEIYFDKPLIEIEQRQNDILSPFLVIQFLQVLKRIVQKGLKRSYYKVVCNLEGKVKGKVLTARTIKENIQRNCLTRTVCQYDEFGYDSDENKILKKAYLFSRRIVRQYKGLQTEALDGVLNYIYPAFEKVSDDIDPRDVVCSRPNVLYKEYDLALKLALLILRRYSYNITRTEEGKVYTPPFWIDMSKLFELYVFRKLREVFPEDGEVKYHLKLYYRELDFVIKSRDENYVMVVDAKYKPNYKDHQLDIKDIRQVCGYARMERVYGELGLSGQDKVIDCLVIYSHQEKPQGFGRDTLKAERVAEYVNFYKVGIGLPEVGSRRG